MPTSPLAAPPSVEAALLAAPVAAAVLDAAGRFVAMNEDWTQLLGGTAEELTARPFALFAGAELAAQVASGARADEEAPVVLRALDGTPIRSHLVAFPVPDAPGHTVVYAPTAGVPEAAFLSAPIGMGLFGPDFKFLRVNPALAALFDAPPQQLLGRSYQEFLHPDDRNVASARMHAAREGALFSGQVERRYVTASGRVVWIRAAGVRATSGPSPTYFGIFLDVSELRDSEQDRERLREQLVHAERLRTLGQLAGGIAHEINNPASIAVGGVDLARRRVSAAMAAARSGDLATVRRQLENLEAALQYCEDGTLRVAQAARRLAAFSGLRSGRIERADLNEAVRRAVEFVSNELRHRSAVVVELGALPLLPMYTDRVVQVVTNLLVNAGQAIDGTPEAHSVTVRTWASETAVFVSVADTGVGMSREVKDRLFEPFFTSRGKERGTGLGLTVVRDVVRQHGGKVDVWSEPGRGSRFTVELPIKNGLEPTETAPPRPGRVLVIDDEPFLIAVLSEILRADHEVVTAAGGREALAILARDTAFDAVLCDLMMPEVDGIEVHAWLRAHAPSLAPRTVFCTGGAFTPRAESYLERTGLPVLCKPFSAEDVIRSLGEAAARGAASDKKAH